MELLHFDSDWARRQPAKMRAMELLDLMKASSSFFAEK
jgi:hypothetical protein